MSGGAELICSHLGYLSFWYRRIDNHSQWQFLPSSSVEEAEVEEIEDYFFFLSNIVIYPKEYFFCTDSCTVKAAPSVKICKWPVCIFPPFPTGQGILNLNLWWKKKKTTKKPTIKVKRFSSGRTAVHLVGYWFQQRKSKNRDIHISSSKDMFQFRSEELLNRTEGHLNWGKK